MLSLETISDRFGRKMLERPNYELMEGISDKNTKSSLEKQEERIDNTKEGNGGADKNFFDKAVNNPTYGNYVRQFYGEYLSDAPKQADFDFDKYFDKLLHKDWR